jgi:EmrB/QacA subfamily drug resistance transporter
MSSSSETPGSPEQVGLVASSSAGRWVIAGTVLGSGIAAIDATVVGIALPRIGRDFHTGIASLQWIVTGYTLSLAGLLIAAGALGDRFGRRRVFVAGVIWFAIASAACGAAPNATTLIVARVVQGVGGALLTPGSLAILQASFAEQDRARAIGAWSGLGGLATAAGPLLGGALISLASWRWVFYLNLPVSGLVVWIAARHMPESRDPNAAGSIDATGAVLALLWLSSLTYALIEGPVSGWGSARIVALLLVSLICFVALLLRERSALHPMLPLGVFREHQFSAANAVTFAVYGALGGALFLLPTVLQVAGHYSPTASGTALLPVTLIMLVLSARSGRLAARIGPRLQMSVGPVVVGAGLALLIRAADAGSGYLSAVLPGAVVFGFGLAITVAPLTSTALSSVPAEHAGIASAVNNDVARIAGLLAVALLPPLAGITGNGYRQPAVVSHGFRVCLVISAATCVAAGVLAALTIRNPARAEAREPRLHCALDAPPPGGGEVVTARPPAWGD